MKIPEVDVFIGSDSRHLEQIYSGFDMLSEKGLIQLNYLRSNVPWQKGNSILKVILNKKIHLIYELRDHQSLIDMCHYGDVDICFKRSFSIDTDYQVPYDVVPLGLNYLVFYSSKQGNKRSLLMKGWKNKIEYFSRSSPLLSSMAGLNGSISTAHVKKIERLPTLFMQDKPKILFMTRTWPVHSSLNEKQKADRLLINEMRYNIVRAMNNEFGKLFTGGIYRDQFSERHFKDALIAHNSLASKQKYFKSLQNAEITITSTGLIKSTGWRLGEYVAMTKAIITEKLTNIVPGNFQEGRNYLEFTNVDECILAVHQLLEDKQYRAEMMWNNYKYYHEHLRPDVKVFRTLDYALKKFA